MFRDHAPNVPGQEAIADTGPILHLHEIEQTTVLGIFTSIVLPEMVSAELQAHGVDFTLLGAAGCRICVTQVGPAQPETLPPRAQLLQPADHQVFALARARRFGCVVLTDDLALRRILEAQGTTVVGSIGIVVRAYTTGRVSRDSLHAAVEALLERSTLHLSRALRAYVRQLVDELP